MDLPRSFPFISLPLWRSLLAVAPVGREVGPEVGPMETQVLRHPSATQLTLPPGFSQSLYRLEILMLTANWTLSYLIFMVQNLPATSQFCKVMEQGLSVRLTYLEVENDEFEP